MPVRSNERTIPNTGHPKRLIAALSIGLVFLTYLAFNTVLENDFVNYDDQDYVTRNDYVRSGLHPTSAAWAFRTTYLCNWTPLTWLSHMLDVQLFGLDPAGHHLTSLLIHLVTVLLLFWWLACLTKAPWSSAIAALVWAIHPLRVESVAWIAERKDVLCGFWALVTLWAYVFYVQKQSIARYLLVLVSLVLGLMSKPMLVSWPFVLLLIDFWPLRRAVLPHSADEYGLPEPAFPIQNKQPVRKLVIEKIPLLMLSALFSVITYLAQKNLAMASTERFSWGFRLQNATFSYIRYLGKIFYPVRLSVLYPQNEFIPVPVLLGSVILLLAITISAAVLFRRKPYLLIGWLWYLVTLVPVIGLVQVGLQSIADRYTYLPSIGITFAVVRLIRSRVGRIRLRQVLAGLLTVLVATGLLLATWIQTVYWKNSLTLFHHAVQVTRNNYPMQLAYAGALAKTGEVDEAILLTYKVHQALPSLPDAAGQLGDLYVQKNEFSDAVKYFEQAIAMKPKNPDEYLGKLGAAYALQGEYSEAVRYYQEALRINPCKAALLNDLAMVRKNQGDFREAAALWKKALSCEPFYATAMKNLAWVLATCPDDTVWDPPASFEYAERACSIAGTDSPAYLDTLAAAYAACGDYRKAADLMHEALKQPSLQNNPQLKTGLEQRLELYKSGRPYRE